MALQQSDIELIEQARQGDKAGMERLALIVQERLCAYFFRVALNHDVSLDLAQETILQMMQSLDELKKPEWFWSWLYRIARNKLFDHYRRKQKNDRLTSESFYQHFVAGATQRQPHQGLDALLKTELSRAIISAMRDLTAEQREVLSLRCFDQLSFAEIGAAIDCSEPSARVIFYRAKLALKKQLKQRGLGKGALLLCLGYFGRVTAPVDAATASSAAGTISASVLQVSAPTIIAAGLGAKAALAAAVIVIAAAAGTVSVITKKPDLPTRAAVTGFQYTIQARTNTPGTPSSLSSGAFDHAFFFPEGIDGPLFMRRQRWSVTHTDKLCEWLQNEEGNYYYHCGNNEVYTRNHRLWLRTLTGLVVRRLPSDPPEFIDFLSEVEGVPTGIQYRTDKNTGMLVSAIDNRFVDARNFRTTYSYNSVTSEQFRYTWPDEIPLIDLRDDMHKRGWTYFKIEGFLDSEIFRGEGRIPFFYKHSKEHPAWLRLDLPGGKQIIDMPDGAMLFNAKGEIAAVYPGGSFFRGLPRPWTGMHTIDIIRRDAAQQRFWFETTQQGTYTSDANVLIVSENSELATNLIYKIDMMQDTVKSIEIKVYNTNGLLHQGQIELIYYQDIDGMSSAFSTPTPPPVEIKPSEEKGISWLIELAQKQL
ncbi:MAG: RNA polymerase sigma factor [Sedimentisphaerales bacterium]|nr:RNA polymerase sigma factor [Sedimentisphaerales bacterium]